MSAKNWIDLILQSSTPSRPNTGIERAYLDNDGNFKTVNSSGVISDLSSAILPIDLASEVTGTLPIANGGTGQTTQTDAFDALAPTTTQGDIIYHNGSDNVRLAAGTDGQVLTLASGVPSWASGGGGGMTDFDLAADTGTPETVNDGETVTIAGGTNIATAVSATNTVTINLDDADLNAIAALASNGLITRTGAGTAAARTITGTSGRITASNGDGVSGDPTLDLATTAVTPASYTNTNLTVDAYGRITAASNGSGSSVSYAILRDEKSSGTNGGTSTNATWNPRDLNTEMVDADSIVSIASNKFTPISGTYRLTAFATAGAASGAVHRMRLYNVTGAAVVKEGLNLTSPGGLKTPATLHCNFTANGTDEYRIDHYTQTGQANTGLGNPLTLGTNEVYLEILLEKVG